MKVAMVGPDERTEKGIAVYTISLVSALKRVGIDVDRMTFKRGSLTSFLKIIPKLLKYDIVHIQNEYGLFGTAGIKYIPAIIFLKLLYRGRIITTFHTVHARNEKLFPDLFWLSWIKRNLVYPLEHRLAGSFSSRIVMHAGFLADIMVNDYGVDYNKITVIPQLVKDDVKIFDKDYAKMRLGLKGNVYLVLGHMSQQKGIDTILDVAKKIGKTTVITGHPKLKKDIYSAYVNAVRDRIKKEKLVDCVRFDDREMDSNSLLWQLYLSAADIVLMPYLRMTTSGIFVDAMAYKKPIVANNKMFFREISKKFKCLMIAKTKEDYPAVISRAMQPKILKAMEKECARYAVKHSPLEIGKKYRKLYGYPPLNS